MLRRGSSRGCSRLPRNSRPRPGRCPRPQPSWIRQPCKLTPGSSHDFSRLPLHRCPRRNRYRRLEPTKNNRQTSGRYPRPQSSWIRQPFRLTRGSSRDYFRLPLHRCPRRSRYRCREPTKNSRQTSGRYPRPQVSWIRQPFKLTPGSSHVYFRLPLHRCPSLTPWPLTLNQANSLASSRRLCLRLRNASC